MGNDDVRDTETRDRIRRHYDDIAPRRPLFRKRHRYYHDDVRRFLRFVIPKGSRVLDVGCADGVLLMNLHPSYGVGIDFSGRMIEAARSNAVARNADTVHFVEADIESVRFNETFDFVILSDVVGNLVDIQAALDAIRSACNEDTRIVINYHTILWEPLLKLGEAAGYKMPQPHHNWLTPDDLQTFLTLCDYELVRFERRILFPVHIPPLSFVINRFIAPLPFFNRFCLSSFAIVRMKDRPPARHYTVSIVIPCRNEKGNIRPALERIPRFGREQEIIFVDGHSTDGTLEQIHEAVKDFPDRRVSVYSQPGKGKADAVRLGFSKARGDVLMILDADLTVPPEDLPRFYDAIARDKGTFINGSRLVYPMEKQAMRFLNMLGNKFFSHVFSWLLNQRLKDTLCGTKVLLRKDYERIAEGRAYFGDFDPFGDFDLLFGAAKLNLKILELPIRYRERTYGRTNIHRFRHGWILITMVLFALRKLKV
jgi:SAM-dependent methyltransferase